MKKFRWLIPVLMILVLFTGCQNTGIEVTPTNIPTAAPKPYDYAELSEQFSIWNKGLEANLSYSYATKQFWGDIRNTSKHQYSDITLDIYKKNGVRIWSYKLDSLTEGEMKDIEIYCSMELENDFRLELSARQDGTELEKGNQSISVHDAPRRDISKLHTVNVVRTPDGGFEVDGRLYATKNQKITVDVYGLKISMYYDASRRAFRGEIKNYTEEDVHGLYIEAKILNRRSFDLFQNLTAPHNMYKHGIYISASTHVFDLWTLIIKKDGEDPMNSKKNQPIVTIHYLY